MSALAGGRRAAGVAPGWSLGAVSRETGIGPHTLRSWERRYGFPQPARLPSGHRRYTPEQVARLRWIARALQMGHRASEVVPADPSTLRRLVGEDDGPRSRPFLRYRRDLLDAVQRMDRRAVSLILGRAAAEGASHLLALLDEVLEEVGAAWEAGLLSVAHEHLLSQAAEDRLRALRLAVEPMDSPPTLLLAGLPGERHGLGLQAVALRAALEGVPVQLLGTDCPAADIVRAARAPSIRAVGLSVSSAAPSREVAGLLAGLAASLPPTVEVWVGGSGARRLRPLPPPVRRVGTETELTRALRRLSESSASRKGGP